jgi:hypothetical protein
VKVAQYEVLGNGAKRHVRPAIRDDRNFRLWSRTPLSDCQHWSIVPPSLRCRAAFSSRARRSSKSEGGILTTADRPGRIGL